MTSTSKIRPYALTGHKAATILHNALRILKPHLPICLPIYRRLQFGRFFDATCILSNIPLDNPDFTNPPEDSPWLLAFVDRQTRPETEVWFFASWEILPTLPHDQEDAINDLTRNLIRGIQDLGVPTSIHQDLLDSQAVDLKNETEKDRVGLSRKDYGSHVADSNICLWGAVHERTVPVLERLGFINLTYKNVLMPNHTFVWRVEHLPTEKALPPGLRWGELQLKDFPFVRSRTQIPRQDRTLATLPNLGIFPERSDSPISWAFVGLDASLTTLHVEQEYRGKGLAKALTAKLFREKMDLFWEDVEERLAHGYVIVGNEESEGMCRSLGGTSEWEVYWLRVDLGAVQGVTSPFLH